MADDNGRAHLYEFAVLHHPRATKEEADARRFPKSTVVSKPQTVLARTPDEVSILAAKSIPDEYVDKLDEVEILVRPF